ncbi:hypothetical protein DEU56DRAFT_917230 [Suillus clintonianus]|uniref:uncharacterized protein n=1 Tax=Suillus clintonianus TaxID=1904413 RepID=UPI001B872409|nr:uncharacterized protein DEU56DRAFT_917230 [Suillus clintonianus]KAG2124016.1 hypothetical protein DEU56DRAFT_917230 [Suillus clintonianus]
MSAPDVFDADDLSSETTLAPALVEALLACAAAPDAASTEHLSTLATTNNPRFWDGKKRSEQWCDKSGRPFTMTFPAILEPLGKHTRMDPYFSLPTLKQPLIKEIRTAKAQFQLKVLDDSYPIEAVRCSMKAQNTLMYLGSECEKKRKSDGREVVQFMRSAGPTPGAERQFIVSTDHLFPDAAEITQEAVPEFSLEDFENTDVRFTAEVIKERFSPKKKDNANSASRGASDWTLKDMPDPQGHYRSAIELYGIEDVPVVVPNIRDAAGVLIHPSEYSNKFTTAMPVVVDVNLRLWTFGVDERRTAGSRVYQTGLRSMKLLPLTGAAKGLFTSAPTKAAEGKGKRKADGPAGQGSPTKRGAGHSKAA